MVATVVSLPALQLGFVLDDWLQRGVVRGDFTLTTPAALFNFGPGNAAELEPIIRQGPFPWFTLPELKLRFLRPVSSALIAFDTRVFGEVAWPQHLHSTLWYVAFCAVAMALYRKLVPSVALVAGLLFAIDDAHVMPTAWLANRNALVAATFVWLGLLAHLAWRRDSKRWAAPLSAVGFALGLAAGETAVAAMAYVLAYELWGRDGTWKERLRGLLPALSVLLVYAVVYKLSNAGARGSATYIDPVSEPGLFLAQAPQRWLANVGSAALGLPDLWLVLPPLRWVLIVAGVLGVIFGALAWRRWGPADEVERRTARWLLFGALGSLLPTLATFPAARLLTCASLGLAPVIALVGRHALRDVGVRRVLGVGWLGLAFVLQPLTQWVAMPLTFAEASRLAREGLDHLQLEGGERVIVVSSTDFVLAIYGVPLLAEQRRPMPKTWHVWSMAPLASELTRTAERVFELQVLGGQMVDSVFEENFRSGAWPFAPGDAVQLDGMRATVLAVEAGKPTRVRFELDRPCEDFVFAWWTGGALERLELPSVGATRQFPRTLPLLERLLPGQHDRLQ